MNKRGGGGLNVNGLLLQRNGGRVGATQPPTFYNIFLYGH